MAASRLKKWQRETNSVHTDQFSPSTHRQKKSHDISPTIAKRLITFEAKKQTRSGCLVWRVPLRLKIVEMNHGYASFRVHASHPAKNLRKKIMRSAINMIAKEENKCKT
jgi:hypothetical protein